MARAVYRFELNDPDFTWLMNSFQESHPEFVAADADSQPMVYIKGETLVVAEATEETPALSPALPAAADSSIIQNLLKGEGKD